MTEILLIRHAENEWVQTGKLAGRMPGVHLNDYGKAQAAALGERLHDVKLYALYSSPMERARETAEAIAAHHPKLTIQTLEGVNEMQFGAWQGQEIRTLARRKMWRAVQGIPSRAHIPEGETFRQAQARAVDAIEWLAQQHPRERVAVASHSDIIKLIMAHYLGMHLDHFQRLRVATASISTLHLGPFHAIAAGLNDTAHCPPRPDSSH